MSVTPGDDAPLPYRSKTDLVADQLRSLITSGQLAPATVLRQRELAERFGVSPTPVREALRRLEAEGFVSGQSHRGVVVVRTESDRLQENALIRATLEGLAAELAAARIDASDMAELERLNHQFAMATSPSEAVALNRAFHFRLYEVTGSAVLLNLLNLLWRSLPGGPRVDRSRAESAQQHNALLEALRRQDGSQASARTRAHIMDALAAEVAAETASLRGSS